MDSKWEDFACSVSPDRARLCRSGREANKHILQRVQCEEQAERQITFRRFSMVCRSVCCCTLPRAATHHERLRSYLSRAVLLMISENMISKILIS